ncbi:M20 family metallopeptidase [Amycolatopsis pithecellobii]|uniref:M20/M25/M40 family metallo-hydrolase n=1 Tax=Amycolatopsis pithecellobii TaxID=664692 RepID=A0A6N7YVD3_9PSEU|nr:M20/M25/M40 family metallo-hydrolase [Amycolatopsis pithecellobii]MTD57037.1 M20/M25/M40 family metallo-hydrolase [Amycolatopsis pithecellobii]
MTGPKRTDELADAAAAWLARLIRIPSVNPTNAGPRSGEPGEAALSAALGGWLEDLGASWVEVADTPEPGRPNVYAFFEGSTDAWIAQDTHLDTVAVEHMTGDPFSGELRDGRVWGRGAVDTKGALASMLAVLERFQADGVRPTANLLVVGTVGEEAAGLLGACAFRDWLTAKGVVLAELLVSEPTSCAPVFGHKGGLGLHFTVHGKAGHSSRPEQASNAIYGAARLVALLEAEHDRLQAGPATTEVGKGSVAVTMIDGGHSRNIIPDTCTVYAGRRLVPGEEPGEVAKELTNRLLPRVSMPVTVEQSLGWRAVYRPPDSPLCTSIAKWSGHAPDISTLGTNAFVYGDIAEQLVVFGPGAVEQAHAAEEWCEVTELGLAARVYDSWLRRPR